MPRTQAAVAVAFAALSGSVLALTMAPIASADPLAAIRQAVNNARAGSTCPPLNYSIPLEGEAQHAIGNNLPGVPPAGQYKGTFTVTLAAPFGSANNAEGATRGAVGEATPAINDCSNKDFGVGFFRKGDDDTVAIVLGKPAAAPQAPPAAVQCPAGSETPTVPAGQTCKAAASPNNLPVRCTGNYELPAGSDCSKTPNPSPPAPKPPKNAIAVNVEQSPTSVAVNVKNTSTLPGKCTYDAAPKNGLLMPAVHRDFNVNPNDATKLDFLAPPLGVKYHLVVSCHGTFNGQDDEFGHVEQDVTGGL
ncbi:hypothetical protein A5692_23115 [Mycobacterium sp. E342]|nr:hypothetical protein A5692_23115 [Mycobacterium sp. E342]